MSNSLRMLFTGDYCPIGPVTEQCRKQDWEALFGDALPVLRDKDVSVVNLECPLADAPSPIAKTGPALIAPTLCADSLIGLQADVAALANNHILDQGEAGLRSTLLACRERGVATVGAGMDLAEAAQTLFVEREGWRVAIINIAENEWSTTTGGGPGAASLDPVDNARAIRDASREADAVIVVAHGGHELYALPSPRMVKLYRFFVDMGAAAVVGHHTHVTGAYEVYRDAPIYYSLGNFVFPWSNASAQWRTGMLLRLDIHRGAPIEHNRIFIEQANETAALRLLNEQETTAAEQKLSALNAVLADDEALAREWRAFAARRADGELSQVLGLNKWRRGLFKRDQMRGKIAPSGRLLSLLNRVRCESHRDVLAEALRRELEGRNR